RDPESDLTGFALGEPLPLALGEPLPLVLVCPLALDTASSTASDTVPLASATRRESASTLSATGSLALPAELALLADDPVPPADGLGRPAPPVSPSAVAGLPPGLPIGMFPPTAAAAAPTGYLRNSMYC